MADTAEAVKLGQPQAIVMNAAEFANNGGQAQAKQQDNNSEENQSSQSQENTGNTGNADNTEKPTFTAESLKEYFKSQGIEFEGTIEDIKEKLKPQTAQPSPEEIQAKEEALERRMLQVHLDGGGKVEDFASVKKMLTADVSEVSKAQLHQELTAQGFDEEEAKTIAKQMFLQEDLNNLERDIDNDESEEDFQKRKSKLEKKVKYGADNLANRSLHIQNTAKSIWDNLKSEVERQDDEQAKETKFSATVDEYVKALPKSLSFEIGKIDNQDIEPIVYNKAEDFDAIHKEVADLLKDTSKRNDFFFTPEGQLNLTNITDLFVKAKIGERAAKEVFMKGGTRQVGIFEKMFPNNSGQSLGVGGTNQRPKGEKGQPVSTGQPQRVKVTQN